MVRPVIPSFGIEAGVRPVTPDGLAAAYRVLCLGVSQIVDPSKFVAAWLEKFAADPIPHTRTNGYSQRLTTAFFKALQIHLCPPGIRRIRYEARLFQFSYSHMATPMKTRRPLIEQLRTKSYALRRMRLAAERAAEASTDLERRTASNWMGLWAVKARKIFDTSAD